MAFSANPDRRHRPADVTNHISNIVPLLHLPCPPLRRPRDISRDKADMTVDVQSLSPSLFRTTGRTPRIAVDSNGNYKMINLSSTYTCSYSRLRNSMILPFCMTRLQLGTTRFAGRES